MINIVVVEDEIKVQKKISALIENLSTEYKVVGAANNGLEGISLISESKPDLVITDIKMPIMNGLDMIRELCQKGIHCKFVILSGFADFRFARDAMKLGSVDYLLKPISIPELKNTLHKVNEQVENEKETITLDPHSCPIQTVVSGAVLPNSPDHPIFLRELKRRLGGYKHFGILLLESPHNITPAEKNKLEQLLADVSNQQTTPPICSLSEVEAEKMMMVLIAGNDMGQLNLQIQLIWEKMTGMFGQMASAYELFNDISNINGVLQVVKEYMNWSISFHQNTLLNQNMIQMTPFQKFEYPVELERSIVLKINSGNLSEIHKDLEHLQAWFDKEYCYYIDIREAMLCLASSVLYSIRKSSYGFYDFVNHVEINDWIRRINSTKAFIEGLLTIIIHFKESKERLSGNTNPTISNVLHIIATEYNKNISLESIADRLNLTAEYVSSLFTKELGISFITYLTQFKVDKAKEMLVRPNIKIYHVAHQVGYHDVAYFCKVFKRYTGQSPKDYVHSLA